MSFVSPYMQPATLVSYDNINRTAQVSIAGLTDGVSEGITAMIAYPIGDDDLDTERELIPGADVWVFFEQGDTTMPIVAFYRRHGQGRAVVDVRRIRQKNIEVLARATITLKAQDIINMEAATINMKASTLNIDANIVQKGNYSMTGDQDITGGLTTTKDVVADNISLIKHPHGGVRRGDSTTDKPNPI